MANSESTGAVPLDGRTTSAEAFAWAPRAPESARIELHAGPPPVRPEHLARLQGSLMETEFMTPMPPALSPPIVHAQLPVPRRPLPRLELLPGLTGMPRIVTVAPAPELTHGLPDAVHNRVVDLLSAQWHEAAFFVQSGPHALIARCEVDAPQGGGVGGSARVPLLLEILLNEGKDDVLARMRVGGDGAAVPLPAREYRKISDRTTARHVLVPQASYRDDQLRVLDAKPHHVRFLGFDSGQPKIEYIVAATSPQGARAYYTGRLALRRDDLLQTWVVRGVTAKPWTVPALQLHAGCRQWLANTAGHRLPAGFVAMVEEALHRHREQLLQAAGVEVRPSEPGPRLSVNRLFHDGEGGFDKWNVEVCFVLHEDAYIVAGVVARESPHIATMTGLDRWVRRIEGWRNPLADEPVGPASVFTETSIAPPQELEAASTGAASR